MNLYEFESENPKGVVITHRVKAETLEEAQAIAQKNWSLPVRLVKEDPTP